MAADIANDKTILQGEPVARTVTRLGRYTLKQRLGVGGMAEVYLAEQDGPQQFKKRVVVKRILPSLAADAGFVAMFVREAQVAARLTHTHVVQIYELGEQKNDDGSVEYFIAMEHIDGLTLQRLASASWAKGGAVPVEVVLRTCADAARGLHAAHTLKDDDGKSLALVHRDISPDNLMVSKDGVTKVLDFGIAKGESLTDGGPKTRTGQLRGKVPYMAPEQIHAAPLDGRTDLWSLGVSMYWLLCGERPFDRGTDYHTMAAILNDVPRPPRELNPGIPEALEKLILAMMDKDPAKRPATGAEVAELLEELTPPNSNAGRRPTVAFVERFVHNAAAAGNPLSEAGDQTSSTRPLGGSNEGAPVADKPEPKAEPRRVTFPEGSKSAQSIPLSAILTEEASGPLKVTARDPAPAPAAPAPATPAPAAPTAVAPVAPVEKPRAGNHPVVDMLSPPREASAFPALLAIGGVIALLGGGAFGLYRWSLTWSDPVVAGVDDGGARIVDAGAGPVDAGVVAAPHDAGFRQIVVDAGFVAVYADAGPKPVVPVAPVDAGTKIVRPKPPVVADAGIADPDARWIIRARGPARIEWRSEKGALFGTGSKPLSLPPGIANVIAVDPVRRIDVKMPVRLGQALDYEKLPSGTLQPKQVDGVKIFIERDLVAGSGPVKVVEGSYEIRVTQGAKILSKKTIEFQAGKTVVVDAAKP